MEHRSAAWAGVLGLVSAAPAGDYASFTEEAEERGLVYTYPLGGGAAGWGLAFGDLDGDDDPDLLTIGQADGAVGIWDNDGTGHFVSRSAGSGIPNLISTSSLLLVDIDRDGDLDIFFGRYATPSFLYRNDGSFAFVDVSQPIGLVLVGAVTGCAAADYDGNGWIDLYAARYGQVSSLFRNDQGVLTDVAGALGVQNNWNAWQAVWIDCDADSDLDLYVSNDKKYPQELVMHNRLYRNDGDTFLEISDGCGADINAYSMGVGVGDVDNNSHDDLYCANLFVEPSPLLLGFGDATFLDVTTLYEVGNFATAWATTFFDFDHDGRLDLYVCNAPGPNRLYVGGDPPWTDVAAAVGAEFGTSFSHSLAAADVDADGDIDLAVQVNGQPLRLLINHEGTRRPWVALRVRGEHGEPHAIGARASIRAGSLWQYRTVMAGGNGFKGQHDMTLHFGLGDSSSVDEAVVTWPGSGAARALAAVPAGAAWSILPPSRLGDSDGDGDVDPLDAAAWLDCVARTLSPGCEWADFTGEFVVDARDLAALLARHGWPSPDCDGNGTIDLFQVLDDPAIDLDGDGRIDSCMLSAADFDGDGTVDDFDLGLLLGEWSRPTSPADLDGDGAVGPADLAQLLAAWSM